MCYFSGGVEQGAYLSSGLYANNFFINSVQSADAFGINLSIPVPSFCGKLKFMCEDLEGLLGAVHIRDMIDTYLFILASSSGGGEPNILCIFCI